MVYPSDMHDLLSQILDQREQGRIERYTQNGFYQYVQTRSILAPITTAATVLLKSTD
jgi:hypothetical protein